MHRTYIYQPCGTCALHAQKFEVSYYITIMSVPGKEIVRDFKCGDISPAPDSDIEIGIVEEPSKNGDEALRFLKNAHDVGELTA